MKTYLFILFFIFSSTAIADNDNQTIDNFFKAISDFTRWDLDNANTDDDTDSLDRLGEALSSGDYNGDGWQDLAIGIPNYDFFLNAVANTGAVLILYGSPNGVSKSDSQYLFQSFVDFNGILENDFFGKSLASGDFNCDGITDLAVGSPEENVTFSGHEVRNSVGAVNIFYGSLTGFADNGEGSTYLLQGTGQNNAADFSESNDRFGWSLVAANFNGDSDNGNACVDLAVSAPFEAFGQNNTVANTGVVDIFYGSLAGISGDNRDRLSQNTFGVSGNSESNDRFGLSLTAGRFRTGSAFDDLAVGIPGEDIDGQINAGAVQVFNGQASGFNGSITENIWSQSGDIEGAVEPNDGFGFAISSGDFNGDQAADLVVGATREDLEDVGVNDAGAVHIIYGGLTGLSSGNGSTRDDQLFTQNTNGIEPILGLAEENDFFGSKFATGDLNFDNITDLVIGVERENEGNGAFHIIYGSANGLTTVGNEYTINGFTLDASPDEMSYALAIGDFGNGPELAVALPGDNSIDGDDDNDAGSVRIYTFINPDMMFKNSFEQVK